MRTLLLAGAVTFPVLAALLPAQTIVVSGGGAALQQAVTAAPLGAILDVMPGTYSPVVVTQGLRISLRAGANVVAQWWGNTNAISVAGLQGGQQFLLDGSGHIDGLLLQNCAGDVVVDGIDHLPLAQGLASTISSCTGAVIFHRVTGTPLAPTVSGSMSISGCPNVTFTACRLPRLVMSGSRVSLSGTSNQAVYGFDPGIDVVSGSLVVDGCTLDCPFTASWPLTGPGIRLQQGELVATGATRIGWFFTGYVSPGGIVTTGGTIRLDPSVQIIGGITGPAAVQTGEIPSLAVSHTPTTLSVALTGEPGSAIFTLVGLPMSPVPTPWGDAWLSPADPILDIAVLGVSGASGFSYPLANVPPLAALVVQSVALTPTGALVIGAPARIVWD